MNARIVAYMVVAVAAGFLLVSAVPEQVSMLAAPQETLRVGEAPEPEGPMLSSGTEEGELGAPQDSGLTGMWDLYRWWAVDLVVAFSAYWLARRRYA